MALAVDPAEVARLRAELLERYGLSEAGMSTRAIASASGVSKDTVARDLRRVSDETPADPVTGNDGKTYQPTQPAKTTVTERESFSRKTETDEPAPVADGGPGGDPPSPPGSVDPAEDARRRQLLAERRERMERRDRAEAALASAADAALDGLPLGITWQSLDVDTFGADEPERASPSGHGAIVAALREFEALRPPWQHDAACRDVVGVTWFPERGESAGPAKAICGACPVAGPCKDYAIENGIRHGVWGGVAMGTRSRRKTA